MAVFTVDLTPSLLNQASEGSLDTSVSSGLSNQRTVEALLVVNGSNRKQLYRLADGETYDNTTFATVVPNVTAGHPTWNSGAPVVAVNNVTVGHPTASSDTGSTI